MRIATILVALSVAVIGVRTGQAAIYTYDINPFPVTLPIIGHALRLSGSVEADTTPGTTQLVSSNVSIVHADGSLIEPANITYTDPGFELVATETTLTLRRTGATPFTRWGLWEAPTSFFQIRASSGPSGLAYYWGDSHGTGVMTVFPVAADELLIGTRVPNVVPEPATLRVWSLGLVSVGSACVYRRKRARVDR